MKKVLLVMTILFSSLTFGQENLTNIDSEEAKTTLKRTNSDYVLEIINNPAIERIYIVLRGFKKEYFKEDINLKTEGEFLIISYYKGRNKDSKITHRWKLKEVIFIEEYENVIKIRLDAFVGV